MDKQLVTDLLNEALELNKSLFLIDFSISSVNHIRVIVDGDDGVPISECVRISRNIEHNLDEELEFSLEVASFGAGEPLTQARQYKKNLGRKLRITTIAGEIFEGENISVDDIGVTLTWKAREPKPIGKGKHTVVKEKKINFDNIKDARVVLVF
jgi:ribosome maturation factor RimP